MSAGSGELARDLTRRGGVLTGAVLAVVLATGCRDAPRPVATSPRLPFIVKVRDFSLPAPPEDTEERGITPARFPDRRELARELARELDRRALFTVVAMPDEDGVEADLELDVEISGRDFGAPSARPGAVVFSTLTWLFAGHASWLIRDRHYPDSGVFLTMRIRSPEPARRTGAERRSETIFEDVVPMKGLELAFGERLDPRASVWNILLPPAAIDGDAATAGRSLARRTVESLARSAPAQIVSRLPVEYFNATRSFVVYDEVRHELLIASDEAVVDLSIHSLTPAGARRRRLDRDLLGSHEELRPEAREAARLHVSQRAAGIAAARYYRVPLESVEAGLVRARAVLHNGAETGPWTILTERTDARPLR